MSARPLLRSITSAVKRHDIGESVVRRNPLWYPPAARLFAHLAAAGLEERRAFHARRLARVLTRAGRTDHGRRVASGATLADWPLLEPAAVRDAPRDFVLGTRWALSASTGGTTGVPVPLWRSPRSIAVEQAAVDHLLRSHGVSPRSARVAVLRGDDVKPLADRRPPFWTDVMGGRRRIFSSNHLTRDTVADFAGALTAFRADYWWVYPTTLEALVRLADEAGLVMRVPLVLSSSEVLSTPVSEAAARLLGATVLDHYGQAERVAFAWSDRPGEYRFLAGYAHVELLHRGEVEGLTQYEIVGTPLWNEAMPLVRYRTGDLVETPRPLDPATLEAVTLGLATFPGVHGRDGDILVAPDGTRVTGIDHFHRGVARVSRIQVLHETPERVRILVIPGSGFGDAEREQLLANARRKLPPPMTVSVDRTDALERTVLGKTPFIVRRPGVPGPRGPR